MHHFHIQMQQLHPKHAAELGRGCAVQKMP